ncbi:MAG: TRAP transporter small permease [Gemmobacter sp.]
MPALLRLLGMLDRLVLGAIVAAACAALGVAAVLVFGQVILRFVFSAPVSWADAAAQMLIVWMVHLGVAVTMRTGALVSVDFLRRMLGPRPRLLLEVAIGAATLAFLGNLIWYGLEMAERAQVQRHAVLGISMAWGYAAVPVGAALSTVTMLARLLEGAARQERPA